MVAQPATQRLAVGRHGRQDGGVLSTPARLAVGLLATTASLLTGLAPTSSAAPTGCYDPGAQLTVEEQRLDNPVPAEILARSHFDALPDQFANRLCAAQHLDTAQRVATAD